MHLKKKKGVLDSIGQIWSLTQSAKKETSNGGGQRKI
jgi:hypothetical protein